ncbi:MAG: class II fructose-bisphosphate aldolase [Anaerolineales bacterium]
MLTSLNGLLNDAKLSNYAVGAFNVYNLEGIKAVVNAAEAERSPAILQLHPSAFRFHGSSLLAACLESARSSTVPMLVHLDHATTAEDIEWALTRGITSIMADGSSGSPGENLDFTSKMAVLARQHGAAIEAELGRLSGSEDGLSIPEYEARLTDPQMAVDFVQHTGVDALAVCIGNIHGHYHDEPKLDFDRLETIQKLVSVPLVLHGASGLSDLLVHRSIDSGVRKFNVNTEIREAYLASLRTSMQKHKTPDLIDIMNDASEAMQVVVVSKLQLFRSTAKA